MKHDFANARRGAVITDAGKTRVTMYLDNDVLEYFRGVATAKGRGYQTEINAELRKSMSGQNAGVHVRTVGSSVDVDLRGRLEDVVGRLERLEQHVGHARQSSSLALAEPRATMYAVSKSTRSKPKKRPRG